MGFFALGTSKSNGAIIQLEFDSVVATSSGNNAPAAGSPFHVKVRYEVPLLAGFTTNSESSFYRVKVESFVAFGSTVYSMDSMFVIIGRTVDPQGWRARFGVADGWGSRDPFHQNLTLNFTSGEKFIDDPTRLPSSFSEWNLPAANFNMFFNSVERENVLLSLTSNTTTNLSLSIIPEPSFAGYALVFAGAVSLRHRRRTTA